jgi:UDP-N-acetylglucosamine:LPS N-acetylglucosamine transferase
MIVKSQQPPAGADDSASAPSNRPRIKLMVVLAGGGYLLETQCLLRGLGDQYDYCYITGDDCMVPSELSDAEVYRMRSFAVLGEPHFWQRVFPFLSALFQARAALSNAGPHCVVCVGTAMAVPLGIAAKTLGIRLVYVESITRYERASLTARIVARLRLADRLYVQWPDSTHLYPGGIYRGTVL